MFFEDTTRLRKVVYTMSSRDKRSQIGVRVGAENDPAI